MQNKDALFEKMIWEAFGQDENFDLIRHQLLRIRKIMCDSHKSFAALPAKKQYLYSLTINIIAIHSTTKEVRQFSLSKDKKEVFKYAISEGFVKPEAVKLKTLKKLN